MNYNELYLELEELTDEEFNINFIRSIANILGKARNIYINNLKSNDVNNSVSYRQMIFMIDELLKSKLKELDVSLTNSNINNIVSGIEKDSLIIINDIIKFDNYIFLEGTSKYDFSDKNYLILEDNNLKNISSSQFTNIYENSNYLDTQFGKNVIEMLTIQLNIFLKNYFGFKDNVLLNNYSNILVNMPCIEIYLNLDLNTICKKIINNEVCNVEMVYIFNDKDIHLFNVNIVYDSIVINEIDSEIWKLSDNTKKKVK